jgi:site-specific DNA recombinase
MKRAIAYARYSSFNQNEISIDAQLRAIGDYAAKKKIEIIREPYIDEAKTATNDSRPNFLRMIADLEETQPDLVLVHKLDRFARNRIDAALYRKEIQDVGARLVAVEQDFGDTPEAVLMEALLEGNAEYFSRNLSKEVKKGQFEAVTEKHTHCGGMAPLGYDIGPDKNYIINEHEAAAVKLIYQRKLEGKSYRQIIEELNELGYRTKKGRPFGANSLHDILRNEKYIGNYIYRKTSPGNSRIPANPLAMIRVEGALPSIIAPNDWYKVQDMMDSKRCLPRARTLTVYLLTGLAKCSECGQAMVGNSERQKGRQYEYYRCNNAKRTAGIGCSNRTRYNKDKLEQEVLSQVKAAIQTVSGEQFEVFVQEVYKQYLDALAALDTGQAITKKELNKVQLEIDNLIDSIASGVDASIIAPKLNELGKKKDSLGRQIKKAQPDITVDSIRVRVQNIINLSFNSDAPVECRQDLSELLDAVIVSEKPPALRFKQFGIVR